MNFLDKLKGLLPRRTDNQEVLFFKIIIYVIIGVIILMVAVGMLVFFLNIDELEKTKVPDVMSNEYNQVNIIDAALKLQEKGLNLKIQVRHSSQYARGIVIDQKPKAGADVKVGRHVTLTISNGPVLNKVGTYVGESIEDVYLALQEIFASGNKAILQIQEPVEYDYSESVPIDHIIEQSPEPGTDIVEGKVTYLKFVVSLGPETKKRTLDSYLGLNFKAALERVYKSNFPFIIQEETEDHKYKEKTITFQDPAPGEELPVGKYLKLRFNPPEELEDDMVFGFYEGLVRSYDVSVPVRLEAHSGNSVEVLYSSRQRGGELKIPYILEENSELILYVLDEEVDKIIVQAKED